MIKFLIEKEFKQLLRNSFLPKLIFIFPCMIMILMPWAASLEIKNIHLDIVDNDHSASSRKLVDKIIASTYFHVIGLSSSYSEGLRKVEAGEADIILEIPRDFEKNRKKEENAQVLIAANAVNGMKGGLGSSYLAAIINDYAQSSIASKAAIRIDTQNLFNPYLNYKLYMIPALMAMLLTLLCGLLPALNVVSEKEVGTIEQINVTPVPKFIFILAKLLPYWSIGFLVLTICFGLAWLLYGIAPVGSLLTIYFFAILFVLVVSGLGLVISNYSATLQQAMFVMWFCLLILILMSGLFTPVSSMPAWAQVITYFNPLRYFMEMMRMVYLKGSSLTDLYPQLGALSAFALVFNIWAVKSYRKT